MATFELLSSRRIGAEHPCFIIAEIGQNHQGDTEVAKKLIKTAFECGADCVKFQKSHLPSRFNKTALSREYTSRNSWGATYGEHRSYLEFSEADFIDLQKYALDLGIPFAASGMDIESIDFLHSIDVPFFKIGSGDANNMPIIEYTAKLGKPVIVSTGMQEMATVRKMYESVVKINKNLCVLQCTSCYPTPPHNVNLNMIKVYEKEFPEAVIGYSGHEIGIGICIAAVALGAKVLERHLTLDHTWKGSDHIASLEPSEFKQMVHEVRNVEQALKPKPKVIQECELDCYNKLAKTVVASQFLPRGTVIEEEMLDIKVAEPKGWKAENVHQLIGKQLVKNVEEDCSILLEYVT